MRLFIGLSLPAGVRESALHAAQLLRDSIPGRYVPAENYHITLAFLGDVPQERLAQAQDVLARCAAGFPAPRIELGGADFFGREQNAILILRAAGSPPLTPLHQALTDALARADLPFSPGPFSPHITLARHAAVAQTAISSASAYVRSLAQDRRAFTAQHAHLYLSARDSGNVLRYTPLFTAPFCETNLSHL